MTSTFERVLRQSFSEAYTTFWSTMLRDKQATRLRSAVFFAETWQYFAVSLYFSASIPLAFSEKTFILKCMLIEWVCIPFTSNIKFLVLLCRFIVVFYLSCSAWCKSGANYGNGDEEHKASQPESHRNSCHELNYYFFSSPCLNFLFAVLFPLEAPETFWSHVWDL